MDKWRTPLVSMSCPPVIPDMGFMKVQQLISIMSKRFPWVSYVHYTVRYLESESERDLYGVIDPAKIIARLQVEKHPIRKYEAMLADGEPGQNTSITRSLHLEYRLIATDPGDRVGLTVFGDISKLEMYELQEELLSRFGPSRKDMPPIVAGTPCEVLAIVVDMRGFTAFCERAEIESPYVACLLTGFYDLMRRALGRYPPTFTKYLGDGLLALWVVSDEDRAIAVKRGLEGLVGLFEDYREFRRQPGLNQGAPDDIAASVAFGWGARLPVGGDYTGHPVNLASRLCAVCPPATILIARGCPDLPEPLRKCRATRCLKSFGQQEVYEVKALSGNESFCDSAEK